MLSTENENLKEQFAKSEAEFLKRYEEAICERKKVEKTITQYVSSISNLEPEFETTLENFFRFKMNKLIELITTVKLIRPVENYN